MAFGTVVASFTIGGFSLEGLQSATRESIDSRWDLYKRVVSF
jgi:hypothetical protein